MQILQDKKSEFTILLLQIYSDGVHINGYGINMVDLTDIIFLNKLNISMETQIIGRGNRCGRIIPLNVHKIYYSH
jgi:hypothetical protein